MFQYQQHNQYFAQVAGGFEELAGTELKELGAKEIVPDYRGFHFKATPEALYRINYKARLLIRVLAPLITFDCHSDKYLHQTAMKIDWSQFMTLQDTFAINAVTSNTPGLTHSQYAALKVKDAICDVFREKTGERPNVDAKDPDLGIHLYVRNNRATISIDTSGGSLHKRGYRTARVDAPMAETLAAAIIRLSGWKGERPLIDPMSGSGTLLCEAAMRYCWMPAGYLRTGWGFKRLPDFDSKVWMKVKNEADGFMRPLPPFSADPARSERLALPSDLKPIGGATPPAEPNRRETFENKPLIIASDIDPVAARATRRNLNRLPGCKNQFECSPKDFRKIEKLENMTIVVNPPYGVRLGNREEAELLMKELGDFLKQRCTGCTAYVYAGDRKLLKRVGLKPEWKHDLNNGALEGVLGKYDLY